MHRFLLHQKLTLLAFALLPGLCTAGAEWPPVTGGLAFAWTTALEPAHALDARGALRLGWQFTPSGRACLNHDGAMVISGGGFYAEGIADHLGQTLQTSGACTMMLWVIPGETAQDGVIARIGDGHVLTVKQAGEQVKCVLKSEGVGDVEIAAPLPVSKAPVAVAVACDSNALALYMNGEPASRAPMTSGALLSDAPSLLIGARPSEDAPRWNGVVEGIAIYARALTGGEIRTAHEAYAKRVAERIAVPQLKVRVRLAGKSTVFTPKELAPYTQGLGVFRYDVLEVLQGKYAGEHLHVAHWTVLDQELLPFSNVEIGTEHELVLEFLDDNPQLASENLSDDIVDDFSLPYYYDAGGRAIAYAAPGG